MITFYGDPDAFASDLVWRNIQLSLSVRRGSFFQDLQFGSRLHLIKTSGDADLLLIEQYCTEALSWMIAAGRVRTISVSAAVSASNVGRVDVTIEVNKGQDNEALYRFFQRVI